MIGNLIKIQICVAKSKLDALRAFVYSGSTEDRLLQLTHVQVQGNQLHAEIDALKTLLVPGQLKGMIEALTPE